MEELLEHLKLVKKEQEDLREWRAEHADNFQNADRRASVLGGGYQSRADLGRISAPKGQVQRDDRDVQSGLLPARRPAPAAPSSGTGQSKEALSRCHIARCVIGTWECGEVRLVLLRFVSFLLMPREKRCVRYVSSTGKLCVHCLVRFFRAMVRRKR